MLPQRGRKGQKVTQQRRSRSSAAAASEIPGRHRHSWFFIISYLENFTCVNYFNTPAIIAENAIRKGYRWYTPNAGTFELCRAICHKLKDLFSKQTTLVGKNCQFQCLLLWL
ncbi:hypothetical protein HN51_031478 [Arachis hypogaea]